MLLDEQHAHPALVGDLPHGRQQLLDDDRGQPEAHLVEHHDLRVGDAARRRGRASAARRPRAARPGGPSACAAPGSTSSTSSSVDRRARGAGAAGGSRRRSAGRTARGPPARWPDPRRATSCGLAAVHRRAQHLTVPPSAGSAPAIVSSVVDLPAPLAPSRQTTSPSSTVRSSSRTTRHVPVAGDQALGLDQRRSLTCDLRVIGHGPRVVGHRRRACSAAEVGGDHRRVAAHLVRGAVGDLSTELDDVDAVADARARGACRGRSSRQPTPVAAISSRCAPNVALSAVSSPAAGSSSSSTRRSQRQRAGDADDLLTPERQLGRPAVGDVVEAPSSAIASRTAPDGGRFGRTVSRSSLPTSLPTSSTTRTLSRTDRSSNSSTDCHVRTSPRRARPWAARRRALRRSSSTCARCSG